MKQKDYLLLKGWLYLAVVVAIPVIILNVADFKEIDTDGLVIGTIILLVLSFLSYSFFKKAKSIPDEKQQLTTIANAPAKDQLVYYKRMLLLCIPAFIILSIWIIYDLNSLEFGTVQYARIWAPVAFLYNSGGYWLAVLATPVIGLIVIITFIFLILKLKCNKVQ